MTIEEVIDRAINGRQTITIEYCTRYGNIFVCEITDIRYSSWYGGAYIQAYRRDIGEERTFKVSRIMTVNGHALSQIYWNQLGDFFKRLY